MADLFTKQLDSVNSTIYKMNKKGYVLSGSYAGDKNLISENKKTKNEYISSGAYDRTNAFIDSKTKHSNPLDNLTDYIVGGHSKAKKIDDAIGGGIDYVSSKYDSVMNIGNSAKKIGIIVGVVVLLTWIVKK